MVEELYYILLEFVGKLEEMEIDVIHLCKKEWLNESVKNGIPQEGIDMVCSLFDEVIIDKAKSNNYETACHQEPQSNEKVFEIMEKAGFVFRGKKEMEA